MAVIGGIRIIPEGLTPLYQRLKQIESELA